MHCPLSVVFHYFYTASAFSLFYLLVPIMVQLPVVPLLPFLATDRTFGYLDTSSYIHTYIHVCVGVGVCLGECVCACVYTLEYYGVVV